MGGWREMTAGFRQWWGGLRDTVLTTAKGLALTWRYMFRPTITELVPYSAPRFRARFRGFHTFHWEACIGCWNCVRDCPVDCIEMETAGKGKNIQVLKYGIDYGRCIFCALCEDSCPTDAAKPHLVKSIAMGSVHDLSGYSRGEVYVDFVELAKKHRTIVVTADLQRKPVLAAFAALPPVKTVQDLIAERESKLQSAK